MDKYYKIIKYYNAISFKNIADINLYNSKFNINQLNNKSNIIILVKHLNSCFITIINDILPLINIPFIIISILEDSTFPNHFENLDIIYNNKYFKHLFVINSTISNNDKITCFPYGLNYHSSKEEIIDQDILISLLEKKSKHFSERIPKIYCNFQFNITDNERSNILNNLNHELLFIQEEFINKNNYFDNLCNYTFILSPRGHGLDCIRTFEGLVLGCIPILKKNELNLEMYNDLPVLIVNEWTDITNELLHETIIEFKNKIFNYKKITLNYYINLINEKLNMM